MASSLWVTNPDSDVHRDGWRSSVDPSASASTWGSTTEPSTAASRRSRRSAAFKVSMRAVTSASIESGVAAPRVMPVRMSSSRNRGLVMPRARRSSRLSSSKRSSAAAAARASGLRLGGQWADLDADRLVVSSSAKVGVVLPAQRDQQPGPIDDPPSDGGEQVVGGLVEPVGVVDLEHDRSGERRASGGRSTTSRSFVARLAGSMRSTSGVIGVSAPNAIARSGSHGSSSGAASTTCDAINRPAVAGLADRSIPKSWRSMVDARSTGCPASRDHPWPSGR